MSWQNISQDHQPTNGLVLYKVPSDKTRLLATIVGNVIAAPMLNMDWRRNLTLLSLCDSH